jgi:hypothetical protein
MQFILADAKVIALTVGFENDVSFKSTLYATKITPPPCL